MAFGVLVQTWGVLWRPLGVKPEPEGQIDHITAIFRLHNFLQDKHVTPVVVAEEYEESCGRRPSLSPNSGDVMPENFGTDFVYASRRARDMKTRAALT